MEMVLMDEKGDKIPATVRKTLISRFETNIHEGDVYNFRSLGVASNCEVRKRNIIVPTQLSNEKCVVHRDWFTPEFLNDMKYSGIPNHRLKLKIDVPVMLLRNIDQASGLCNGTRLLINELCI
ncbi:uncharacterized protein [Cicer arietinum]|uniref:uncharacterized protein n=1 Tax=Cicer arietinum TaxID=3827 RepID=UPI003CC5E83C